MTTLLDLRPIAYTRRATSSELRPLDEETVRELGPVGPSETRRWHIRPIPDHTIASAHLMVHPRVEAFVEPQSAETQAVEPQSVETQTAEAQADEGGAVPTTRADRRPGPVAEPAPAVEAAAAPSRDEDPAVFGEIVVTAVLEAAAGHRPVQQLARHFAQTCFDVIRQYAAAMSRRTPTVGGTAHRPRRPRTVRSHAFQPTENSAEVSVVVHDGARVRAVALRLERRRQRWIVTEFGLL